MAIPDEDVLAVRQATDIVALIAEYTSLKRQGRRYVGLCPFHSERTGSFSVNGEEGLYHCFGCQASGDAITFVRAVEGASFVEAVERLAARAGITVRNDAGHSDKGARDQRDPLYEAMAQAADFYHRRLLEHPDAARARQYLRSRGLDGDVVRKFRLGWAPEGGSHLVRQLKVRHETLIGAGLALQGNYGPRDSFRGRVIFPIFQVDGKPVALGGRLVPGVGDGSGPKYRNSAESPIYQKRSTLYALNFARQEIVHSGEVIVCEGYTDVIGMFRVGMPRAVATCGTALTEDHFKLLSRFGRRVVLAFDADRAGEAAAARVYEWERRHEVEVAVAALPPGRDPGDLASEDPEALQHAIENAESYLEFRLSRVLVGEVLRTPELRAKAADMALEIIAEHPHELVREQYLMRVSDLTRMDPAQLRPRLQHAVSHPKERNETVRVHPDEDAGSHESSKRPARKRPRPLSPGEHAGRDALALVIHEPAAMAHRVDEALFAEPLQRSAYAALARSTSLREAIATSDDEIAALLVELATSDPEASPDQAVVALVRAATTEAVAALEADARAAQAEGDEQRVLESARTMTWLKSQLETFAEVGAGEHLPPAVTGAADRLVAWLTARRVEGT